MTYVKKSDIFALIKFNICILRRIIDDYFVNWKSGANRKVLMLRGARQVGKTYSIRKFSEKFKHFLEVNFESDKEIHSIFQGDLNPDEISLKLSVFYNTPIIDGETLLFFDEIQHCLPAISSLRYFYEKKPDLHIVAAGSLLEFALVEIPSFGVGRIESVFMYPLSFDEYLLANNEEMLFKMKQQASPEMTFETIYHNKLINYLRRFLLIGGLPEVVSTFIETNDLIQSQKILDNIINGLNDDFAKYKKRVPVSRIRDVFESVVRQAGGKFLLTKIGGTHNYPQLKEAVELLEMAGLVIKQTHTSANALPLAAETNPKKTKLLLFDHGIFQRILGLEFSNRLLIDNYNFINKGSLAEQFVGLELIKYGSKNQIGRLYYWHREKRASNAEVDFVIQNRNEIIPIEVKSGTTGKMQSLRIMLNEKKLKYGIRVSLENFCKYENIRVYPLYAVQNILQ